MFARPNLPSKLAITRSKLVAVSLPTLVFAAGCANPGPPRPPSLHLPRPAESLVAQRVGSQVRLSWTTSAETTDGNTLAGPISAIICRQDLAPNQTQFPSPCNPVQRIAVKPGPIDTRIDLPSALRTGPATLLGFQVELLNAHNRSAGPAATVYTAAGQPPAPAGPITVSPLRNAAQITWAAATGEAPIQLSRTSASATSAKIAKPGKKSGARQSQPNTTPPQATLTLPKSQSDPGGMIDRSIHDGDTLTYTAQRVRTVTFPVPAQPPAPVIGKAPKHRLPPPTSVTVELRGEPSPPVAFTFHDTIPPAAPTGLAAIPSGPFGSAPSIDLSWEPNSELDLLGYNLYRAESGSTFTRLNPELIPGTGFSDRTAQPGHAYSYRVTAVDQRRNESAPSTPLRQQLNK